MTLRVLTWNLMHGRSRPPAGRELLDEFVAALSAWRWDVALLQEVPPWWPAPMGRALGADHRLVLTSRNALLPLRRAIAIRRPDLIKSNGGGCNAILLREGSIVEHRTRRLCWWPERRWMHAIRTSALWIGNLHTGHDDAAILRDSRRAATTLLEWANGAPAVLGGDFNLRPFRLAGFGFACGNGVDLVFARGLEAHGEAEVLERGSLSDHAPVAVELRG